MKKKILLVDDEPMVVEPIKYRLEQEGFGVISSSRGLEALNLARETSPDLIGLDLMLPKMDGFKICRLLKFDEKFKDIPIIVLTSRKREGDKSLAKEVRADSYIVKPFEPTFLMGKIKELLPPPQPSPASGEGKREGEK